MADTEENDDRAMRKKLRLRSWRRGVREMDLLLGPFADAAVDSMSSEALAAYADLLERDDPELYPLLISGEISDQDPGKDFLTKIRIFHSL